MLKAGSERGTATAARATRTLVAAIAIIVTLVASIRWGVSLFDAAHSIAGRYDFSTYYAAALALRQNPHANIYDSGVLARAGSAGHVLVQPPLAYTYPPLFALLLSPLTLLSFRVLSRLWLLGNAALWLAAGLILANEVRVLVLRRRSSEDRPDRIRLASEPAAMMAVCLMFWLTLANAPAIQTLVTGQINMLVLLPLLAVPWLTRHHHERWVGIAVGIATILKFTPGILIIWLLLRKRWQAAGSALIAVLVLSALTALVTGPDMLLTSVAQALRVGTHDATLGHNEALFAPLLTGIGTLAPASLALATPVARVTQLALALAAGWFIWRNQRGDAAHENALYGLGLCVMLLVSPVAWVHHYIWLLPAEAIALGTITLAATRAKGHSMTIVSLALVLVACVTLGWTLPHGWDTNPHPAVITYLGAGLWPWLLELRPLSALLLGVMLAWWASRTEETSSTATKVSIT